MKKNYQRLWLRVVVIDESDVLCTSGYAYTDMYIELNDYKTYGSSSAKSMWQDETGSDF